MNKRLDWADRARGIAVLLIFSVHFFLPEFGEKSFLVQLLAVSALPAFYFTSGYFCRCRFAWGSWLKHNARTILLPYLIASLVFWVLHFLAGDDDPAGRFLGIFLQLPGTPWEGERWFMPSFFAAKLVFDYTAARWGEKLSRIYLICLGYAAAAWVYTLLGGPRLPWNMEAALLAQPFFVLGIGWKRGAEQRYDSLSRAKKAIIAFCAVLGFFLLAAANQKLGGRNLDFHARQLNEVFTAYGASVCALFLLVRLGRIPGRLPVFLGRNSLICYLYSALAGAVTNRILAVLELRSWAGRYLLGTAGLVLLIVPGALVLNRYFPWAVGRKCPGKDQK